MWTFRVGGIFTRLILHFSPSTFPDFLSSTIFQSLACLPNPTHALKGLIPHSHTSYQDSPPSTTHPPTSFIHVSIRTCHSLSVRPFISPGHRFSLNGWIPCPWHFGHHMSTLPSLHYWPFVRSNWTDSSAATVRSLASQPLGELGWHLYTAIISYWQARTSLHKNKIPHIPRLVKNPIQSQKRVLHGHQCISAYCKLTGRLANQFNQWSNTVRR